MFQGSWGRAAGPPAASFGESAPGAGAPNGGLRIVVRTASGQRAVQRC